MKKVILFTRSCKNMQDCDRQVKQLKDLAMRKGWEVEAVFREQGSGTMRNRDRKELIRMIEYVRTHHIDKVLVTEFNRLGRDFSQTFEVLVQFNMLGVSLYVQDYAKDTLLKTVLESQQMRLLKISAPEWHTLKTN
ncbi:MAG: recombinase family protein [Bacteroidaceae bacterium]|nr:recombinase family protein [Bacteroidaceae bacterium]